MARVQRSFRPARACARARRSGSPYATASGLARGIRRCRSSCARGAALRTVAGPFTTARYCNCRCSFSCHAPRVSQIAREAWPTGNTGGVWPRQRESDFGTGAKWMVYAHRRGPTCRPAAPNPDRRDALERPINKFTNDCSLTEDALQAFSSHNAKRESKAAPT